MNFIKRHADILIVLIIGFALRVRIISSNEFWYDEAFTGILLKLPFNQFWEVMVKDVNPPLYYLFTKVILAVTGPSDLAIRAVSLFFGMALICIAFLISRKLFEDNETAILTALLVAVSPFFVEYSVEARAYTMYGFLMLSAFYMYLQKKFPQMILVSALALATHYLAIIFILNLAIIIAANKSISIKHRFTTAIFLVLMCTGTAYYAYTHSQSINSEWVTKANLLSIQQSIGTFLFGLRTKLPGVNVMNELNFFISAKVLTLLVIGIMAYAIGKTLTSWKKTKILQIIDQNLLLVLALAFLPMLELLAISRITEFQLYVHRYIFPSAVFFILALGYILRKLFSLEILFFVMISYFFIISRVEQPSYYNGIKELAQTYRNYSHEIIFTAPMEYTVGRYYFGENANIRLLDPQNPEETYFWWPLVKPNPLPTAQDKAIYINPDASRFANQDEYIQINSSKSYHVYMKKPVELLIGN